MEFLSNLYIYEQIISNLSTYVNRKILPHGPTKSQKTLSKQENLQNSVKKTLIFPIFMKNIQLNHSLGQYERISIVANASFSLIII